MKKEVKTIRVNRLRNLIRKHRVGLINDDELKKEFSEAYHKYKDFYSQKKVIFLRLLYKSYSKENIKVLDSLIFELPLKIKEKKFEQSIEMLQLCNDLTKELERMVISVDNLENTQKAFSKIELEISSIFLDKMPSFQMLKKYLNEANNYIKKRQFVSANLLVNSSFLGIKNLNENNKYLTTEKKKLYERLKKIETLNINTARWEMLCPRETVFNMHSHLKKVIQDNLENGKIRFCSLLIDDIELISKSRSLFYSLILRIEPLKDHEKKLLTASLEKGGWVLGNDALLKIEIKRQSLNNEL